MSNPGFHCHSCGARGAIQDANDHICKPKIARPEDLRLMWGTQEIKGFTYDGVIMVSKKIPPLDITIELPDGKRTGIRLNLEKLIPEIYKHFPKQMMELIKE